MQYMNHVLERYQLGGSFPISRDADSPAIECRSCGIEFNLHTTLEAGQVIICPQCLKEIEFKKPFPVAISNI